jgi:hypothetical protein
MSFMSSIGSIHDSPEGSTFSVDGHFIAVRPDQTFRGMTYSDLMADWWNWVYSSDPDHLVDNDIAYLRGNLIGDPYYPEAYALRAGTPELVNDVRTVYDRTGFKGINITTNTALFFSVYDTNFVVSDQYEGKELMNSFECRIAARREFNTLSALWATFRVMKDGIWTPPKPIITDEEGLKSFYAESSPFKLVASGGNRINREPAYYLQGPKEYEGVALGVFLLLTNFKEGKYRLDIGGISGVDYFTRAVYDINVTDAPSLGNKDISEEMAKRPYPPDDFEPQSRKLPLKSKAKK